MIQTPEPLRDCLHQVGTPYARANARLYSETSKGNFPREYHDVSTAKAKQAKEANNTCIWLQTKNGEIGKSKMK